MNQPLISDFERLDEPPDNFVAVPGQSLNKLKRNKRWKQQQRKKRKKLKRRTVRGRENSPNSSPGRRSPSPDRLEFLCLAWKEDQKQEEAKKRQEEMARRQRIHDEVARALNNQVEMRSRLEFCIVDGAEPPIKNSKNL